MTNQVIPEAALDAARDVLYENDRSIDIEYATLEAALEAAAPHMLAEAWDEGHHYGTRGQVRYQEDSDTNPYRPTP